MNRIHQQRIFIRWAVACVVFGFCGSRLFATVYNFDITNQVDSPFGMSDESSVNLDVTFAHIESVSISLSGTFTPGLKTWVTIPANSSTPVVDDQMFLDVRIGNENSQWFEKPGFAYQDLSGYSGHVDVVLPIMTTPPSQSLPATSPFTGGGADFAYLLDGRFGLSTLAGDFLGLNYEQLTLPMFSTSKIGLIVDGTAIPEPTTATLLLVGMLGCVGRRNR